MSDRPYAHIPKEELKKHLENMTGKYGPKEALLAAEIRQQELEEDIRSLKKPHWTLKPTFWLVLVSTILALISTVAILFQVWQSVFPNMKSLHPADVQAPSIQDLKSTGTNTTKTSQPKHVQKKP
jgi:cytoskeletal protein RodZ